MTEYIERTDAMNAVLVGDVDKDFPCMDIAARLHDIPAADVRPVVHGRWIERTHKLYDVEIGYSIECESCHEVFTEISLKIKPTKQNFCPNCGADMREES